MRFLPKARHSHEEADGERQVIVAEKIRLPAAGEDLRRHPGFDLARLSDRALPAHLSRPICPRAFDDADFAFYGTVLHGQHAAARPRDARASHLLDSTMGEALGKLYVARYFPPEAKAKADRAGVQSAQGL